MLADGTSSKPDPRAQDEDEHSAVIRVAEEHHLVRSLSRSLAAFLARLTAAPREQLSMKNQPLVGAFCLMILTAALAQKPEPILPIPPSTPLPPDLARVLTDYERAWSGKDAAALAKLFVEDGFVLSPGHQMIRGRSAIERFYTDSGGPLSLRAVAFATQGNVGYIIGAYSRTPSAPDDGKFTLTLRRSPSGQWQIVSDMDNGNRSWQPQP